MLLMLRRDKSKQWKYSDEEWKGNATQDLAVRGAPGVPVNVN